MKRSITSKQSKKTGYTLINEDNQYLTGWFGWKGFWGSIDDCVMFDSYERAEGQVCFLFLDKPTRIIKLTVETVKTTKIISQPIIPKITQERSLKLYKKFWDNR